MSEFGKRIRKLRVARGMSAEEVARRLKIASSTYREWENGRSIKGEPYPELARIFQVPLSELFGVAQDHVQEIGEEIKKAETALEKIRSLL